MKDIAVVVITVDRAPGPNYLHMTIGNLERSGIWTSSRLRGYPTLVNSDQNVSWLDEYRYRDQFKRRWNVLEADTKRTPTQNAGAALCIGAQSGANWVLFCEDDIDVCADFLDSVGRWLDDHAVDDFRLYSFGAAYAQLKEPMVRRAGVWRYPVHAYYGTCCFAVRAEDARSLGNFWMRHERASAYDLVIQDWLKATYPQPNGPRFGDNPGYYVAASSPSLIQHMGRHSYIRGEGAAEVTYETFPGRAWSYPPPEGWVAELIAEDARIVEEQRQSALKGTIVMAEAGEDEEDSK